MAGKLNAKYCGKWLKVAKNRDVVCVRRFSHAATNISVSRGQGEDTSYKEAKPFSEIPGPKGLPYLGTLLHYKYGNIAVC